MATRTLTYAAAAAACAAAIVVPFVALQDDDSDSSDRSSSPAADPTVTEPAVTDPPSPTPTEVNEEPAPPALADGAVLFSRSLDQIVVGESWQVELDGDGIDTVALEGPAGREEWEAGEVELVVTLTHSGTHRIALPASYYLTVPKETIAGPGDGVDLLVGSSGGDSASYTIYGFWNGEFGKKTLGSEEPLLVSEEGGLTWQRTGIAADGRLITLRGTLEGGPDVATAWEWSVAVEQPTATELGTYCRQDDEMTWVPC